ncbi:MAG: hypothetical protein GEU94_07200 [Micromonosporaceae bacterium]|nr:hypothetical protein [Micromonosporaceae bacterium]
MVVTSAPRQAHRAAGQVHLSAGVVRTELDRLGMHHVADVQATEHRMLEALAAGERTAFAAAAAERLLRGHEARPPKERRAYPCAWRAMLDAVWSGLAGDPGAFREVSRLIAEFYLSPYHHDNGADGPDDATDDAVAATLYAAQCHLHGCVDFAMWSAACGYDAAAAVASADLSWSHRRPAELDPHTWQLAHPALQAELERQLEDLELLAEQGGMLAADAQADRAAAVERLRAQPVGSSMVR